MPYNNVPESLWPAMEKCVTGVMKDNPDYDKSRAIAICHSQLVKEVDMDELRKTAGEEALKAQQARSKKYGIGIKKGGNVTKPGDYSSVSDEDFGDPVNYRYPLDASRKVNAITRFNDSGNKSAGGYTDEEWAKIGKRIAAHNEGKKFENGKVLPKERPHQSFYLYKEAGRLRWMGVYSNNFIDRDNPPDLITAESHRAFVEAVDKGVYDPPELWVWHLPQYKIGNAEWVAYDEQGFALAGGVIDQNPWAEGLAKQVAEADGVAMSHSMPLSSIRRDPTVPHHIVRHKSVEVSVLPDWAAASQLTGWNILKEVESMAIPENKKKALIESWGISPETLEGVEADNSARKSAAEAMELETKEVSEEPEVEAPEATEKAKGEKMPDEETPEEEAAPDEEVPEDKKGAKKEADHVMAEIDMPALRKEIAEGIVAALQPFAETIVALQGQVEAMAAEKEKADGDAEDAETKELEETPLASVAEYVRKASAIGKEETKVDGRTTLAKGPTQAEPIQEGGTFGIPFIDSMVSGKQAEVEG